MEKYNEYSDESLIELYRQGNMEVVEHLLQKYKPLVIKMSNKLFLIGAEKEDLIQEGMVGLFKAIRDYEPAKETLFFTFAELCINRQMLSALEAASRKKHSPLNSYISISVDEKEGGLSAEQNVLTVSRSPEDMLLEKELWQEMQKKLDSKLSPMERQVLSLYLEGNNYNSIALCLGKNPKAIDNAIQRIRKKIRT